MADEQSRVSQVQQAMNCLTDFTRLTIAKRLEMGQLNPATVTRLVYDIPMPKKYTSSQYNNICHHLLRMLKDQVIERIKMSETHIVTNGLVGKKKKGDPYTQDYVITSIGKEALERKGMRNSQRSNP
jgi:hypothetical protein